MSEKNCCTCPETVAMATVPMQEWCEIYDWNNITFIIIDANTCLYQLWVRR